MSWQNVQELEIQMWWWIYKRNLLVTFFCVQYLHENAELLKDTWIDQKQINNYFCLFCIINIAKILIFIYLFSKVWIIPTDEIQTGFECNNSTTLTNARMHNAINPGWFTAVTGFSKTRHSWLRPWASQDGIYVGCRGPFDYAIFKHTLYFFSYFLKGVKMM